MTFPVTESSMIPSLVGCQIKHDGHEYLLEECLGTGWFGAVYRVHDLSVTTHTEMCAIKVMITPEEGSLASLQLQRELNLHQRVSGHRNIIGFRTSFSLQEYTFIVLDLCSGGDLFQALIDRPDLQTEEGIRSVVVQLIEAVHHCHLLGVFHRDLKPENILLEEDGTVKLADFGLATEECQTNQTCGTTQFWAPEMLAFSPEGYRPYSSDLWALGICLVSIIGNCQSWSLAFDTDPAYRAYVTAYRTNAYFLAQLVPGLSYEAAKIIRDLLNPSRDSRTSLVLLRWKIMAAESLTCRRQTRCNSAPEILKDRIEFPHPQPLPQRAPSLPKLSLKESQRAGDKRRLSVKAVKMRPHQERTKPPGREVDAGVKTRKSPPHRAPMKSLKTPSKISTVGVIREVSPERHRKRRRMIHKDTGTEVPAVRY